MSELLDILLEKRGISSEQKEIFLNPDYKRDFHDPFLMKDMEKACVRLFEAIENKEKIVIYADYDCDGIPGAVIFADLFKKINYKNYEVYIPHRHSEGYGLNLDAIKQFKESGVKLLLTVDLGITAVAEVAQAETDGIDVIITDHHIPQGILPRAYAILNPKTDNYPEKMLCGAGVVFKLIQGFFKKYGEYFEINNGVEKWMLDMAGLATLSDMVPLTGENRALAYFGMKVLKKSPRPGLQKLLAKMNIDQRHLSEDDIGFMITPRLNAASRMDDSMRAFELLATADEVEAGGLADHLSKINDERKTIVTGIMREVNKKFEKREFREVIVIGNSNWRVGVLGLVAGKISDTYKKPVFVWGKDENDCIRGSCRSDGSVSVVELMTAANESFLDFGGHELAGGFTVHSDKVYFLEEVLSVTFNKVKREKIDNIATHDVKSSLDVVNMRNWQEIEKMSPFGFGNPKPVFLFEGVKIEKIKKFGKNGSGEHLEIIFSDSEQNKAKAISFFSGLDSFKNTLSEGLGVNLLATFDLSRFRGREELRLRIIDILWIVMKKEKIIIYTDGAAKGNPGNAGWGAIFIVGKNIFEIGGGVEHATNNIMELTAPIEALKYLKKINLSQPSPGQERAKGEVEIISDSKYVILGITEWIFNWQKNNWRNANKKPVLNRELWEELYELTKELEPKWTYVKGHNENEYNDRADEIATSFAEGEPVKLKK